MKTCAYCGKENEESAVACAECGTNKFNTTEDPPPLPPQSEDSTRREQSFTEFVLIVVTEPLQRFRALVLLSAGTYVVLFLEDFLFGRIISPGVWDALAWSGYGAFLPLPASVSWLLLLLSLAVALGLWTFSKSARLVFTVLTGFYIVLSLLGGVYVQTALGAFLSYLGCLADGAILVIAYTVPLKDKFS